LIYLWFSDNSSCWRSGIQPFTLFLLMNCYFFEWEVTEINERW